MMDGGSPIICHLDHGVLHNPCENESHIAKLSESVIKSELCDSTKREVESIHFESMSKNQNTRVVDDRICEDISTNVTLSTSSVVSCDMQVAFEESEPPILQPASPVCALSLEEDVLVPTSSEEHVIDIGTDLEPQPAAMDNICESTALLVPSSDLSCTNVSAPCDNLHISNFDHVVVLTHKEVLAGIPSNDIVYSIMLKEPLSLRCAVNKISEISYLNSSTHAYFFMFNLIGDYSMNDNFLVDHICITCDRINELKLDVLSPICYVSQSFCCGTLDYV
jgi:hypothetical protein